MTNALRIITAIAGLLTGAAPLRDAPATGQGSSPAVVLTGMTAAEQAGTMHVVELFAQAGLQLPPVVIRRHVDTVACNGHEGLHHTDGDRSVIDICTPGNSGAWEERTILHELSHAWAFHYMTPAQKQAFKVLRGWATWLDHDRAEWKDNGSEQAAEVMVWGLSDHPVQPTKIDDTTCAELHDGYVTLTGLEPLHGYTEMCDEKIRAQRS